MSYERIVAQILDFKAKPGDVGYALRRAAKRAEAKLLAAA